MARANPMWVARQMGHSTMKMLLENYSRWIDLADKQREKSKIEQLFDWKCANSVLKNTEMKISIGYLGGGGGNRTPVRKSSTERSTYLVVSI